MGSSVLGIGLCSATVWGGGSSGCPPSHYLPRWAQRGFRAGVPGAAPSLHTGQSPVVGGRVAQQLLHREQQTGTGTHRAAASVQSPWVPRPGSLPRSASCLGPGGRSCACAGTGQHDPPPPRGPGRLSPAPRPPRPPTMPTCAAPRSAHPEVKVSVQLEPRQHRWAQRVPHHSSMASSWSARSSNMLPMSSRMLPVLFSEAEGLGWAQCEKRGARWGRRKRPCPLPT